MKNGNMDKDDAYVIVLLFVMVMVGQVASAYYIIDIYDNLNRLYDILCAVQGLAQEAK